MSSPNYPPPSQPAPGIPTPPTYRYTRQFLQEQAGADRLTTWGPRFVALLIDFSLVSLPFNILGNLLWLRLGASNNTGDLPITPDQAPADFSWLLNLLHNLAWLLLFAAYATYTNLRRGSTLGEQYMNIKVIAAGGKPLEVRLLFLRYLLIGYAL